MINNAMCRPADCSGARFCIAKLKGRFLTFRVRSHQFATVALMSAFAESPPNHRRLYHPLDRDGVMSVSRGNVALTSAVPACAAPNQCLRELGHEFYGAP